MANSYGDLSTRFWARVQKSDGCWVWTGTKNKAGYGVLYPQGKPKRKLAHRVSWEFVYGPIKGGLYVCHTCDNPPCVNPSHLFLGTQADNVRDCINKGRLGSYDKTGENNPRASMTDKTAKKILDLYWIGRVKPKQKNAPYSSKRLAKMFGVTRCAVRLLVCGKNWRKVTDGSSS